MPLWNASPSNHRSSQPLLAALKSLALPGLGQWHNGQIDKAVWWFLAFAFLSVPAVALVVLHMPPAWAVPTLAVGMAAGLALWLGSAVDAWRVARAHAGRPFGPDGGRPVWRLGGVTVLILVLCDFIALPLLIGAVRSHQVQPFRIPSSSMAPTLWPGDFVFGDMRYACVGCREPVRRGDVVIFANPNDRTTLYVKRVVALPGDRVQVEADELRVNGNAVPPVTGPMPARAPTTTGPRVPTPLPRADFVVPPGHVFALGDLRGHSVDSRHFGPVPLPDVIGKVRLVWFSWGESGVRWDRLGREVR